MQKLTTTVLVLLLLLSACSGLDTADTIPLQETRNTTVERPDAGDDGGGRSIIAPPQTEDTVAASADEAMTDDGSFYRGPETPRDVTFEDYGQNPWVHTGDDALSTFAVDVDTGSYTIMRKWISEGLLPPADSVRTEEYVNFFDLGYEAPSRDTFAVYVDGAHTPFAELEDDYLLRIGIKGREISERRRDPITLTFVIDVSGSMADGDRLGLVKDSLAILVESLDEDDTVAVVAYNTHADIVLEPTSADEYRTITRAIDRLEPGGSTNAEEGLMLGYDLADEAFDRDGINRVVLLSDGVANVGETGPDGILERIGRAADNGIDLLTIGVGLGNYNDVLMEQLADRANGHYRYVDTIDEAERVFADDLTGTLITIARDVKIQVEFDQETVKWYRLVGFENRDVADEDFRNDRVDGGEIGAGHSVTALYQIELEEGVGSRDSLGQVTIRWNDSAGDDVREVSGEITADSLADSWTDTDPHFRLAASVAAYAEALKDVGDRGDYQLEDVANEVDRIANLLDDPDVDDLVRLIDRSTRLFERSRRRQQGAGRLYGRHPARPVGSCHGQRHRLKSQANHRRHRQVARLPDVHPRSPGRSGRNLSRRGNDLRQRVWIRRPGRRQAGDPRYPIPHRFALEDVHSDGSDATGSRRRPPVGRPCGRPSALVPGRKRRQPRTRHAPSTVESFERPHPRWRHRTLAS